MASSKPTLQPGEYGPAVKVTYMADEKFRGDYVVELGEECKDKSFLKGARFRLVRVDGHPLRIYAMVHETEPRKVDRKILRDEDALRERAIASYIMTVLRPKAEDEQEAQDARERMEALYSPNGWLMEETEDAIWIAPLGLKLSSWRSDSHRERKIQVIQRLVELVKEHGLGPR